MDTLADRGPKLSKLAHLLGDIRFGVLTTVTKDGSLWSRPVSTQQANPDGELWLFTKLNSPMANELERHRRVNLCYAKPVDGSYVSVLGTCELLSDGENEKSFGTRATRRGCLEGPTTHRSSLYESRWSGRNTRDAPSATWPLEAGILRTAFREEGESGVSWRDRFHRRKGASDRQERAVPVVSYEPRAVPPPGLSHGAGTG